MEQIVTKGLLYDFYGELLTARQREIYEDAVYNDMTLAEIAQERGISRQGVSDQLNKCTRILQGYEDKLHMIEKFNRISALCDEIEEKKAGAGILTEVGRIRETLIL